MPASWNQRSFRARNDDGSETGATWLAALNSGISAHQSVTIRYRFDLANSVQAGTLTPQLEYNKNGGGWNAVTTSSSNIKAVASSFVTNDTATTNQLAGAGTFETGDFSSDGLAAVWNASLNAHSEFEFSFQIVAADTVAGDAIQLRITNGGTPLDTYSATPFMIVLAAGVAATGWSFVGSLPLLGAGI